MNYTTWAERRPFVTADPRAVENQRRFREIAEMVRAFDSTVKPTSLYATATMTPFPHATLVGEVRANLLLNALTSGLPMPGSSNWKSHGPGEVPDPAIGLTALEDLAFAARSEGAGRPIFGDYSHWRPDYDALGEYPPTFRLITLGEALAGGRDGVAFDEYERAVLRWQHRRALTDEGAFNSKLWDVIEVADENNLDRLAAGFPLEVEAYRRWTRDPDFARRLRLLPLNFSI